MSLRKLSSILAPVSADDPPAGGWSVPGALGGEGAAGGATGVPAGTMLSGFRYSEPSPSGRGFRFSFSRTSSAESHPHCLPTA